MTDGCHAHLSAIVDALLDIGANTKIFCHLMQNPVIGERCSFDQNVSIDTGVRTGWNLRAQNDVSLYECVEFEDDVFCCPSRAFTNVSNPRSEIARRGAAHDEGALAKLGAAIGASAAVHGTAIGRCAFIDYALTVGVLARRKGWVSRHGHVRQPDANDVSVWPESGYRYQETTPQCASAPRLARRQAARRKGSQRSKGPLLDSNAQHTSSRSRFDAAIHHLVESRSFVFGAEVEAFEREVGAYSQCAHAVGLSSGTAAGLVALIAIGEEPDDEVITRPNACVAAASGVGGVWINCPSKAGLESLSGGAP